MNNILYVNNVSKLFKDYSNEIKRILSWFGFSYEPKDTHEILKEVSFSLKPGEAVGIVGRNGAGKSTLLKIITGTMYPTYGSIHVGGKIAAILELGMGFHPDLTGRQNAYHSAGLMGYTNEQIDAVISDIEDFAEIGDYFDQPVRTYSSGMQMRVAFATVTAYRPEILIVDEALSVGDAYFQHKSFEKIRQFQAKGTTLLLVSHDKGAIQAICNRAILLDQGKILKDGHPEEVMDYYNALIAEKENSTIKQKKQDDGKTITISGSGEAGVESIMLFNSKNKTTDLIDVGETVRLTIRVKIYQAIPKLVLGFMIKDRLGQTVFGTTTHEYGIHCNSLSENETLDFVFLFDATLGVGSYSISTALALDKSHIGGNLEWRDLALIFNVANTSKGDFIGLNWMNVQATIKRTKAC